MDTTAPGSAQIDTWTWDFGDGHGASTANPSHLFQTPGNYLVTLTVYIPQCAADDPGV
jgi:PKD repeat protein